jgi:hypothetical protein
VRINKFEILFSTALILLAGCPATDDTGGTGTPPPVPTTCSMSGNCVGASGSEPLALAAADFNKDNLPDLAVVNYGTGVLSILSNQGNGTLQDTRDVQVGTTPSAVVAADLDGDGAVDLAVTSSLPLGGLGISLFRNTGGGTFEAARTITTGTVASAMIAADIDGDGRPELITANSGNNSISVLRNLGGMLFANPVNTGVGLHPSALAAADLTGDGRLDLVVTNRDENTVSVLRNLLGTLLGPTNINAGAQPSGIATGDFNGDGRIDLVITNQGQFEDVADTATILLNTGIATFAAPRTIAVGANPLAVTVADFNLDGHPDLAIANFGMDQATSSMVVLLNKGDGTFAAPVPFTVGNGPAAIVAADLDNNARPDLVVANFTSGSLSFLSNTSDLVFAGR